MEKPHQGVIRIACLLLEHYQPEEISLEVDNEKIILHGQHQCEQQDGFNKGEFVRVFKLPPGVDPATVALHFHQDGGALSLVVEGIKQEEDKANDGKFEAKLDFSGFKPEEIKFQLCGNVLTVTGMHHQERSTYSRCIVLPNDVDPKSVRPCLSKEGLLTIKASSDPDKLSLNSFNDITVTMETNEQPIEKKTFADEAKTAI